MFQDSTNTAKPFDAWRSTSELLLERIISFYLYLRFPQELQLLHRSTLPRFHLVKTSIICKTGKKTDWTKSKSWYIKLIPSSPCSQITKSLLSGDNLIPTRLIYNNFHLSFIWAASKESKKIKDAWDLFISQNTKTVVTCHTSKNSNALTRLHI